MEAAQLRIPEITPLPPPHCLPSALSGQRVDVTYDPSAPSSHIVFLRCCKYLVDIAGSTDGVSVRHGS